MDTSIYTDIRNPVRQKNTSLQKEELGSLRELLKKDLRVVRIVDVKHCFVEDLKSLLNIESLSILIDGFFEIENTLHQLEDIWPYRTEELPNLKDFYSDLSPVLLRALWQTLETTEEQDTIIENLKQAIRIAIEGQIISLH